MTDTPTLSLRVVLADESGGGTGPVVLELVITIRTAAASDPPLDAPCAVPALPLDDEVNEVNVLTKREREVFELVAQRHTNREIAERLVIAESTVKSYMTRIFEKLAVANRHEAADYARRPKRAA